MADEIPKIYEPGLYEKKTYERWMAADAFAAIPDGRAERYVIMMPLPNITGALHMGHAMDNVMQDLLTRWHRMMGDNTLWMPGTDHAGIGTQAIIEKRMFELEGKTRHDVGREGLIAKIQAWKDEYRARIIRQQQAMGCSCDWGRQRFTMDAVCARAVREAFFRLFRDGLIYRGDRMVNWDCQLQTAVSDDEIVHEKVQGHFWHIKYPIIDPKAGEPEFVVVATTRPETMLGDTAVAVHPDPVGELNRQAADLRGRIETASKKDRTDLEKSLERLEERRRDVLPHLLKLRDMAADSRQVLLPLLDRPIPLIRDEWADPALGTGCVKITPAHDPNDYAVWSRHKGAIAILNILNPDGTLNAVAGPYAGVDRFEARKRVVRDLKAKALLESVEDREIEIGHSDRSKTPIEPFISKQWFVRMADIDGGIVCGRGTKKEFQAAGLAQAAIEASLPGYESPSGRRLAFAPDDARYGGTFRSWLSEKRDWCISRQLWWGHRIPIWNGVWTGAEIGGIAARLPQPDPDAFWAWIADDAGNTYAVGAAAKLSAATRYTILVCMRNEAAEAKYAAALEAAGMVQDPDVLDTWFSSALWPMSTLGWPDPATAALDPGQRSLVASDPGLEDALAYYYPGSCLVTARDIITLWVARMMIMGLYLQGDVPFTASFIHANIQDGKGERMSKSKGNGIDPEDIIEKYGTDAMRYVLCDMQTGTQDIRLPVQAVSPYNGELVDLATAKHGRSIFTYIDPKTGKEFDVLGTMKDIPPAKIISERFDIGRAFCTKLWNAARFMFGNLGEHAFAPVTADRLAPEDRWILSRLSKVIRAVTEALEAYNPSAAVGAARDFFWGDLCDWYLEIIKPRLRDEGQAPVAQSVLALAFDQVLRLFHPFVPFITEVLWERLNAQCPVRGLLQPMRTSELLITAAWPAPRPNWEDEAVEADFAVAVGVVRAVRDMRARHGLSPSQKLAATIKSAGTEAEALARLETLVVHMANLESLHIAADPARPALSVVQVVGGMEIYVPGLIDPAKERAKLEAQRAKLAEDLRKTEAKLGNEGFIARAPADVVEKERQKLAEMRSQIGSIEANLKTLG
ncbi:MAG: valine--tRNA ligase [Candidatus Aminicenantes bacterium]|nr:valine--tRNA ligase [Candidatus Aminicenantes bacterium]